MKNIVCGGKAGQGVNILATLITEALTKKGFYTFTSREFESKIRGGHNYNAISFYKEPINSNPKSIDILIALDEPTVERHKPNLKKDAITLSPGKENTYYLGALFKILNIEENILEESLKELKNYEENLKIAKQGFQEETRTLNLPKMDNQLTILSGSQGFAQGAIQAGLEFYYAYPMTPSTKMLAELSKQKGTHKVTESESEIAAINQAIGSAITGAKSMVGTSGGGFDLMTEGLSLAGGSGIPLVIYLAQRHGPATGVPTYTQQGDLAAARHGGHGEFPRILIAPGDAKETIEKTTEIFYLTQKYQTPGILLTDKHQTESIYSFSEEPKITESPKTIQWPIRFTSYESTDPEVATENPEEIKQAVEKRIKKQNDLNEEIENLETHKIYGDKDSKNTIIAWGSTKGAIIDAIKKLDCKFIQILYLEPFSKKIKQEIEGTNIIVIENNATSPLSNLISEKTGIQIQNRILRYDGMPFLSDELSEQIKEKLE